jgi:exodeoxyribonuclease VII small subunit
MGWMRYFLTSSDSPAASLAMPPAAKKPTAPADFESALTELDALVERMESGQLPLEEALVSYKRGMELLQFCHKTLNAAQQQVRILEGETLKLFSGNEGKPPETGHA